MKLSGLNINKNVAIQNKVTEVKDFLNSHYEIRVNEFDPTKSKIKSKTKQYRSPVTFDDISLHLIEDGITVSDNILRKILRSPNQVATFNPIQEYFERLKGKYRGISHIDLLMSHLKVREYPGKYRGYYQERLYKYMKKWFVATTACALGLHPNDVFMGLVHSAEGIGKTYFFNYIVPECLKSLIADPSDHQKFNLEESFARNFLVYFDEMAGINRRNTDTVKKMASASQIDVYLPREVYPIRKKRIASGCFSSNKTPEKGGFLTSNMGYRRWLIFELEEINQDYSKKVDIDQVWAEALMLLNQDYDFRWSPDDWDNDFREYNRKYIEETTSMKYIKMYFDQAENGEGTWLQPREILNLLIEAKKVPREEQSKLSDVKLGEALNTELYPCKKIRKKSGPRNCYYVKKLF